MLGYFNSFNVLFQSRSTQIHNLAKNSKQLFREVIQNFVKPNFISSVVNLDNPHIYLEVDSIIVGYDCNNVLKQINKEGQNQIRLNILKFYITAAKEMQKRLPLNDFLFEKMSFLAPDKALNLRNREGLEDLSDIAIFFKIDASSIFVEWRNLAVQFNDNERKQLESLRVDEFWWEVGKLEDFEQGKKYSNLCKLANIVMSLPHSNADAERIFSVVTDVRTKKRNRIGSEVMNAITVTRSAFSELEAK